MHNLLSFILVCYGCTNILAYGKIFNKIRPKHDFFHCPMCLGLWVGVFFSFFMPLPFTIDTPQWIKDYTSISSIMVDAIQMLACGCLSSGTSYCLAMMINDGGIRNEKSYRAYLDKKI